MQQALTSAAHGTAAADIEANGTLFARHLRAVNKSLNTVKSYMEAVTQLDAYPLLDVDAAIDLLDNLRSRANR